MAIDLTNCELAFNQDCDVQYSTDAIVKMLVGTDSNGCPVLKVGLSSLNNKSAALKTQDNQGKPAGTTNYPANGIVGELRPVPGNVSNSLSDGGYIVDLFVVTNKASITPKLRIHFFKSNQELPALNDHAVFGSPFAVLSDEKYIGYIDMPAMVSPGASPTSSFSENITDRLSFQSSKLFYLIETLDSFTPNNSQDFFVKFGIERT